METRPDRISIRNHRYRGRAGFLVQRLVFGRYRTPRFTLADSMFVETRVAAEHIREKMRRGEEVVLADFYFGAN